MLVSSQSFAAKERASSYCKKVASKKWNCRSRKYVKFSYQCNKAVGTDGCSTELKGKLSKKLFSKFNKVFHRACDLHDVCYQFRSKGTCDSAFRASMRRICKVKYKPLKRARCNATADVFYNAVVYQTRHTTSWLNAQKRRKDDKCVVR